MQPRNRTAVDRITLKKAGILSGIRSPNLTLLRIPAFFRVNPSQKLVQCFHFIIDVEFLSGLGCAVRFRRWQWPVRPATLRLLSPIGIHSRRLAEKAGNRQKRGSFADRDSDVYRRGRQRVEPFSHANPTPINTPTASASPSYQSKERPRGITPCQISISIP